MLLNNILFLFFFLRNYFAKFSYDTFVIGFFFFFLEKSSNRLSFVDKKKKSVLTYCIKFVSKRFGKYISKIIIIIIPNSCLATERERERELQRLDKETSETARNEESKP